MIWTSPISELTDDTMKDEFEAKNEVRELDGYECVLCGTTSEDYSKIDKLPVHHINGEKYPNEPHNLVTLCPYCHGMAHSDGDGESIMDEIVRKVDRVTDPRLESGFYPYFTVS